MVKSHKGKEVDIAAMAQANQHEVALGNARMNARGDILGKGGKIIKTREELSVEYNTKNPNAVKTVALTQDVSETLKNAKPAKTEAKAETKKKKNNSDSTDTE